MDKNIEPLENGTNLFNNTSTVSARTKTEMQVSRKVMDDHKKQQTNKQKYCAEPGHDCSIKKYVIQKKLNLKALFKDSTGCETQMNKGCDTI